MSSRSTLARTLAGALAIAALAAPAAIARPAGPDTPAGGTAAKARIVQNLRSPDAEDAAKTAQAKGSTSAQARYYASYGKPSSIQQPARPASTDGGIAWTMIAAGLVALLILGGSALILGRMRLRTRRAGVAA